MSFLHHLFDRFLHTRHVTRHFARRLILDTLTLGRAPTPATSPDLLSRELQRAASPCREANPKDRPDVGVGGG